ncbi:hypothetical protein [Chitinophaga niabensis]|uniref:Uncharacterized protein n=1 Tax=Chitinophaga niabensis TaxID=536979 RepID=A0A1N6K300_9BACT|nr:hypothetical protein [Chitinophaga niabensis]SIO50972.1 hypothetical protein SAMN04488055_4983 [Chitinophaga niabensis]
MKTVLIALVSLLFIGENKLTGRWESAPAPNGNVTGLVFKKDNTFEGYVNKKPFVTGKYTLEGDILTFTDNACDGAQGVYKINYFSGTDSLRFQPVNDTCSNRRAGMSRLVMGRVK